MSSALYALGRWAFRARRRVLVLWIVALAVLFAGVGLLSEGTDNTYSIPGTESQDALDALARTFPQVSGSSAQLIAVAPDDGDVTDADFASAVGDAITTITAIPQVTSATSPYESTASANLSPDHSAALVPIQLSVGATAVLPATSEALQAAGTALEAALPEGSQVSVGGQLFSQSATGISITELLGIVIAYFVLLVAFASFVAAGLPLTTALLGVGASLSIVLIGTRFLTITSTTPLLALMLGLAVGIDYALFIVSRHQEQLKRGLDPEESAARAVATSGSAVVFAAVTVIIALVGLSVAGIPFLTIMGIAAALAVAVAVLISITLTPALLGFAGWRVVARRYRPGAEIEPADVPSAAETEIAARSEQVDTIDPEPSGSEPAGLEVPDADASDPSDPSDHDSSADPRPSRFFLGWVRTVTRWPIVTVILIVGLLALATVPAAGLRLTLPDAGTLDEDTPGRVTYDLIADHFGPGFNGPLIVTGSVIESTDPVGLMDDLGAEIADVRGVASVPLSTPNESGDTGIVQVIPDGSPDSEQTKQLVSTLRSMHDVFEREYGVDLSVTGYTAAGIDISDRLAGALLPFGLLVVGLSLVLLAMVFRSIVVPVTAALGYALSIGAAFGLTALVFVDGVGADALNVASVGSVISFMPIILMGVLFGLAMDYEVFLVSRMREDFVHHGEPRQAVETGFVGSARVVTAAAIIMFAVFAAFVPEGDASIQPIAFGLAVGVVIDAFLVRMTLIPAVLVLFGSGAWWIPAWLDRALPRFDIEGEGLAAEFALADWPSPDADLAIAAEGVRFEGAGVDVAPFDSTVAAGEGMVLHGGTAADRSALMLALGGRVAVTAGRLKVDGLVVPARASTVRARTAYVRLEQRSTSPGAIDDAIASGARILFIDAADGIAATAAGIRIRSLLTAARDTDALTIVAAGADPDNARDLLPIDMAVRTVNLRPAAVERAMARVN